MFYRMKFFGSLQGRKTNKDYTFDRDQIVEAPEGEFDESEAYVGERAEVIVAGEVVETAMNEPKVERRGRKPKQ
jgi:hypothetical protein